MEMFTLFIQQIFIDCLYVSDPVVDTEDTAVNKTKKMFLLMSLHLSGGDRQEIR